MTDGRKQIARVLATLCITALSGTVLIAAPTYADPDISSVQSKVDKLYQQAEQASERYNDARLEMKQAQTRLTALQADLDRQQTQGRRRAPAGRRGGRLAVPGPGAVLDDAGAAVAATPTPSSTS